MAKDKYLYKFKVPHEIEKDVEEKVEGGTLIKKVKTIEEVEFAILRPTRQLIEDAELFYGVKLAQGLEAGLMPRALLAKRYANDAGVFSKTDLEELAKLRSRLFEISDDITRLTVKAESERTEEENGTLNSLLNESITLQNRLQNYETAQNSLFENTAESRARYKVIMWYVLFLSYIQDGKNGFKSIFSGASYDDKIKAYDDFTENDQADYLRVALDRLVYFVTFFYSGKVQTPEDFKALEDQLLNREREALEATDIATPSEQIAESVVEEVVDNESVAEPIIP